LVDSATVPPSPALELLREFSGRPGVAVFATNDPALGSIRIGAPDGADERLFVTYSAKSEGREATLFAASSWREHSRRSAAEHGLDAQETWRGLILAQACRRHEIDALVCGAGVLRAPE
jgi:hypothetical protein